MPDIQITVLSENPEYTAKTYQVQAVKRDHFFQVRRVIKASDGLISGGGSLLQDKTSLKSIPYYAGIIQLAKRMKKPVFIYSQGIGPVSNKMCRWIVRKTLNQADGITVRDERSKKLLEKLGVKDSVTVVPDPVMGLELPELSSTLQQSAVRRLKSPGVDRDFFGETPGHRLLLPFQRILQATPPSAPYRQVGRTRPRG